MAKPCGDAEGHQPGDEHDHTRPDRTVRFEPFAEETLLADQLAHVRADHVEMTQHQPDAGAESDRLLVG